MPGFFISCTGYSLSEPLILTSTNPNYDDRLFVELRAHYKKTASSVHDVVYNVHQIVLDVKTNDELIR